MGNTVNRAIDRYTYNPEADKALKEEYATARDKMKQLQSLSNQIREKSVEAKMANVTKDRLKKLADSIVSWINKNGNASSEEIDNQIGINKDKQAEILLKNAGNYYFQAVITLYEQLAASIKNIATRAALTTLIEKEKAWFAKNGDLSLDAYKARKAELDKLVKGLKVEPIEVDDEPNVNVEAVQGKLTAPTVAQKKPVSIKAIFFQVLAYAFFFFLIVAGGSFAANLSFKRPVAFRLLSFVYGCIFFPILILYAAIMALGGKGIVMHALCIPLFEGKERREYLRWFTYNPIGDVASVVNTAAAAVAAAANASKPNKSVVANHSNANKPAAANAPKANKPAAAPVPAPEPAPAAAPAPAAEPAPAAAPAPAAEPALASSPEPAQPAQAPA